ncbi:hypothetical protein [Methylotenera versatilis]|uniref:Uncharacterized protein n=1 Tax=Methylotenera versatilis (strain 301) TaxID=666681 RepID=D7DMR4_METV0|nr:hypothetical protein [Methylotenera versatilis]ADI30841.1 conserved hypothetical protein [Methylotenera versatilis 301]
MREPDKEYLERAANLSVEDSERLLSRMRTKLVRRIDDKKLSTIEAIAIQLEREDEELEEWRENRVKLNEKFKDT